jgi:MFS family permease
MMSDSFAALRYRDFRLLWLGQVVASAGSQMRRVAIAWHIYQLTHDPIALGLISVFRVLPVMIFSMAGGLMADAQDRRKVLLVSQGASLLAAAVLAFLTLAGLASAPIVYLVLSLTGVALAFEGPAQQSLVPNVVPRQFVANAFSLSSIFDEVAGIVAAGAAGVVIAVMGGVGTVYALTAAIYLLVIGTVLLMRPAPRARLAAKTINLRSVLEGARYVRHSPVIFGAMLMDFFATFFASANVLLPIVASDVLHVGAVGYGILSAAPSVGSIIAGAVMSMRSHVRRPGLVMLVAVGVYAVATILFGLSSIFVLSFVLFAFTGAGDTVSMVLRQTIRQLLTPDHLRGRMTSINMIFATGGPQLGDMEAGIAAALWGAPFAVVSGGIVCLLAVLLIARLAPALRDYDGSMLPEKDATRPPQPAVAGDECF